MLLVPKRWAEFQHYKDRSPPWIKLHKDILNNRDFMCLPLASKALAPLLWLLASESKDGKFDADPEELSFRLRMDKADVINGLNPLISKGFFLDASTMLAPCLQPAIPETEGETESEEGKPSSRSAPCPYDEIVSLYMECLPTLPRVIVSNTKRRSLMKKRWSWILTSTKQDGTRRAEDKEQALDWLRSYFERVSTNPFLMGDNDRGWKADIDYLMEDRGLKSVIERMQ